MHSHHLIIVSPNDELHVSTKNLRSNIMVISMHICLFVCLFVWLRSLLFATIGHLKATYRIKRPITILTDIIKYTVKYNLKIHIIE